MQPVLTVSEMREVDERAHRTIPVEVLVERAATAVVVAAIDILGGTYGRRVAVVAGKGNNGADGRMAADILGRRGARVRIFDAGSVTRLPPVDLVIDAAYGTGFRGEYLAPMVSPGTLVLAVDIPSGVNGDTGEASGRVLVADRTVTFGALKAGLLQSSGAALAGRVTVADIGLDVGDGRIGIVEDADVASLVPVRGRDDHKWSAAVLVVAGSPGMTGAAGLCARAAFRSGAGMVLLGVPGDEVAGSPSSEAVGVALPSTGWADLALDAIRRCGAAIVGPGLGRDPSTAGELRRLLDGTAVPMVIDADGLFALGDVTGDRLLRSDGPVVLTPHDGEYERLMGRPPGSDRVGAARRLARTTGAVALLKGSTTAVADPEGRVLLAMTGSPRLATAGTGDVLSGIIGALLARGVPTLEAAALAAHVHGRAAEAGRLEGLMAGDLPDLVSVVLSERSEPGSISGRDRG
jgi:ADP-dependent NAD(P)H-hydrate dehydratase / NAD(P)H-hydrate epimerase